MPTKKRSATSPNKNKDAGKNDTDKINHCDGVDGSKKVESSPSVTVAETSAAVEVRSKSQDGEKLPLVEKSPTGVAIADIPVH